MFTYNDLLLVNFKLFLHFLLRFEQILFCSRHNTMTSILKGQHDVLRLNQWKGDIWDRGKTNLVKNILRNLSSLSSYWYDKYGYLFKVLKYRQLNWRLNRICFLIAWITMREKCDINIKIGKQTNWPDNNMMM